MTRSRPERSALRLGQKLGGLALGLEQALRHRQQPLPRAGQHDPALLAAEQEDIIVLLEFANLVRNGRLAQRQRLGRAAEPAADRDVVERPELDIAHPLLPSAESMNKSDITI